MVDVDGVLRGKYLDKAKFLSATRSGFGFCNVVFGWDSNDQCYDNTAYTGWQSGYPDAEVRIDLTTMRRIPWEQNRYFFLGEFVGDREPGRSTCAPASCCAGSSTGRRRRATRPRSGSSSSGSTSPRRRTRCATRASATSRRCSPGMFGYSILRSTQNQPFFDALLAELRAFDVPLEGLHCETGPGVLEAAILYSDALTAADRAVLFKSSAKEIGHRFGILPTFMARWNTDLPGCSGHAHQSLWSLESPDAPRSRHRRSSTRPTRTA